MSLLRLQSPNGDDLVTIDLNDGSVTVKEPDRLDDAARALWDAVHTIRDRYKGYNDLVIKGAVEKDEEEGPKAGDVVLIPGRGGYGHSGGNIEVQSPSELPQRGSTFRNVNPIPRPAPPPE